MEAKDYPVTFKYGATTPPYSPAHPHLGEDRKMPLRTPINVNGVLVGYAGTTGKSTGVHTHTQRVYGNSVVHPQGGGFEVPQPCVVTETGYKADSIGYYVRYRDGQGFIWSIFHMDKQAEVHVGQQLIKKEADVPATRQDVTDIYQVVIGRDPVESEYAWVNQPHMVIVNALRNDANQQRATANQTIIDQQKKIKELENNNYVKVTQELYRKA